MDDVNSSLADLIARRKRDLGYSSLRAMYRAASLPNRGALTYESFRRLAKGETAATRREYTVHDLALICRVSEDEVRSAEAGYTPPGGWQKYDRLTVSEKKAVEGVMDAILAARDQEVSNAGRSPKDQKSSEQQEPGRQEGGSDDGQSDAQKSPAGGGVTSIHDRRRQKVIDQGQPVVEAADDHPLNLPPDDEDVSQDPDDWGED